LRSGDARDFVVNVRGIDLERPAFGNEIADLLEERFVGGYIDATTPPSPVPIVNL